MANNTFLNGGATAGFANSKQWYIEFEHVATGRSVRFKAFVSDYNESFESRWNEEHVYGRMDPIMTFRGTGRKINLSWECAAENENEAKANVLRCSELIKMLYPVYEEYDSSLFAQGLMTASPLLKIKFANVLSNANTASGMEHLIGTLSGLQYTPDLDSGWTDSKIGELYPKIIRLSTQITVMHTHKLGFDHTTNEWRGDESATTNENGKGSMVGGFPWRVSSPRELDPELGEEPGDDNQIAEAQDAAAQLTALE